MSDSLRPHESQHTRPPCPSPTSGVHSDSRPSSQWCHPAISSSVIPFSSCPQSLPASESFPMSQLFAWGGQSTGASALASFLPKKPRADLLQNGLVGSPCSPRDSQEWNTNQNDNKISLHTQWDGYNFFQWKIASVGVAVDKLEPTYIANGMSNSAIMVENNCQFLKKLSIELLYGSSIPLLII